MKLNAEAPGIMAEEPKQHGALFIHYSSDYVFDGTKPSPYAESDEALPLGAYGASKLAGDQCVQAAGGAYLIFRTSWVYAARGKNFLRTMMNLLSNREELAVVHDQIGTPTWSRDVAHATLQVLAQLTAGPTMAIPFRAAEVLAGRQGVYKLTSRGSVSWYGFAQAILEEMTLRGTEGRRLAKLVPIASQEYPSAAVRPKNTRLSNEKLRLTFGIELPNWRASLIRAMEETEFSWGLEDASRERTSLDS